MEGGFVVDKVGPADEVQHAFRRDVVGVVCVLDAGTPDQLARRQLQKDGERLFDLLGATYSEPSGLRMRRGATDGVARFLSTF